LLSISSIDSNFVFPVSTSFTATASFAIVPFGRMMVNSSAKNLLGAGMSAFTRPWFSE